MPFWRLTCLSCLLIGLPLLTGCAVVRIEPGAGPSITGALRNSIPGDNGLSSRTLQELHRLDLYRYYPDSISDIAARLHAETVNDPRPEWLFALAEISHFRGRQLEKDEDPRATILYFRAAGYAWHYLFGESGAADQSSAAFDPRFRLACDLYNTSLARCLALALTWKQMDATGQWFLPGRDENDSPAKLAVSHIGFDWQKEEFGSLTLCSAYKVVGLGTMTRTYGMGVPLIAQRDPTFHRPFVPTDLTFPVSAVCRFEGKLADLLEQPRATLELVNPLSVTTLRVGERIVPLESDLTTPLAYHLGHTDYEKVGYLSFLKPAILGDRAGLHFLEPHRPGKIPVVLVHGLLSSPQTWVPVINELQRDPVIRKHIRFGVYFYPTGEPYLATAADLRRDLENYRAAVDPEGKDAALFQMVLAGHSMGGLIARLLTVDGGDDFWWTASPVPFDQLQTSPEARERLSRLYYFGREPGVTRVVYFGTPHRGSEMSPSALGRLAVALAGIPRDLLYTTSEVNKLNPHLRSRDCRLPTSVELLAPESPALKVLAERKRPDEVAYHSVIGVSLSSPTWVQACFGGDGRSGDGVVLYGSAHLDDSNSELVIQGDHYRLHYHPLAVRELQRILHEHIERQNRTNHRGAETQR